MVEVNAGPGLLMHLKPAEGPPRPVGKHIVDHLFDETESGRIPIVGVAGSHSVTEVSRLVAWLLQLSGRHVGLACRGGLFLSSRRVDNASSANWAAGHRLLMNREVNAVVLENGAPSILQDGLAYDRCQVGVVTDLDFEVAPELAHHDVNDVAQLYRVLRTQVDVVLPEGTAVLNADNERLVEMASLCDGQVIFFAVDGQNPPWWRIVRLADELFCAWPAHRFGAKRCLRNPLHQFQQPCGPEDGASHQPGRYGAGFARRVRGCLGHGHHARTDHCRH